MPYDGFPNSPIFIVHGTTSEHHLLDSVCRLRLTPFDVSTAFFSFFLFQFLFNLLVWIVERLILIVKLW